MKVVSLLYHDAVTPGDDDGSGFAGQGAAVYKLTVQEMRRHFGAIAAARADRPASVHDILGETARQAPAWLLTFDDGGISAASLIADLLEERGWIGHFFVTASQIDTPTFVSSAQIRQLVDRGHVIGSHSWSHPTRMSSCNWRQLLDEWRTSIARLRDITGMTIDTASVPGGYFSSDVARAASASGIRALFTSEPIKRPHLVDDCLVLGRYTLQRGDPPETSADLSSPRASSTQVTQHLYWNLKKAVKTAGGRHYPQVRDFILRMRS